MLNKNIKYLFPLNYYSSDIKNNILINCNKKGIIQFFNLTSIIDNKDINDNYNSYNTDNRYDDNNNYNTINSNNYNTTTVTTNSNNNIDINKILQSEIKEDYFPKKILFYPYGPEIFTTTDNIIGIRVWDTIKKTNIYTYKQKEDNYNKKRKIYNTYSNIYNAYNNNNTYNTYNTTYNNNIISHTYNKLGNLISYTYNSISIYDLRLTYEIKNITDNILTDIKNIITIDNSIYINNRDKIIKYDNRRLDKILDIIDYRNHNSNRDSRYDDRDSGSRYDDSSNGNDDNESGNNSDNKYNEYDSDDDSNSKYDNNIPNSNNHSNTTNNNNITANNITTNNNHTTNTTNHSNNKYKTNIQSITDISYSKYLLFLSKDNNYNYLNIYKNNDIITMKVLSNKIYSKYYYYNDITDNLNILLYNNNIIEHIEYDKYTKKEYNIDDINNIIIDNYILIFGDNKLYLL